jgi:diguanylate cyclase (GGDEF)-like protein
MSADGGIRSVPARRGSRSVLTRALRALPHGGSLPDADWRSRHRVICLLLALMTVVVAVYAVIEHRSGAVRYIPELFAMIAFAGLASWTEVPRKWRSVSASMGLLTGSAALVDISGGLIEMHFSFFVVVVVLTVYEDWVPFLVAVTFVLIHHGVMGTIDPRAVFENPSAWRDPWAWAGLHALFVALAGAAGVTAWGLNERVRDRMREAQRQLERLGLTDPLTGLGNRRALMADVERLIAEGRPAALAIFDLDGFKEYNDRFGHPAGDALLVRLTAGLALAVAGSASAYRLGGDEFCVLAEEVSRAQLDPLLTTWTDTFSESGEGFAITASSGAALIPEEADDASAALRLCDRRMYARKHSRRATAAAQARDVLKAALAAYRDAPAGGVARTAERLGVELGISGVWLQDLAHAADLHDVGMVAVPASILAKPGPLTPDEWRFVERHPVIGERILAAAPAMAGVAQLVRATHERFDGTGYPDRVAGEQIPLPSRVIAVCAAYEAMRSERPYRRAADHDEALAELARCSGTQFDPQVVQAFVRVFADNPPVVGPPEPIRPSDAAATAVVAVR